jgi:hypothetical protein
MNTLEYTADEKIHMAVIKNLLFAIEKVSGIDNKSAISIQLFDYIATNGIDLLNRLPKLKRVIVNKCRTFKSDYPLLIGLVASCTRVLMALGEPLDDRKKYDLERIALRQGLAPKKTALCDYYDWEYTLLPSDNLNRYQKMRLFIKERATLFTAV